MRNGLPVGRRRGFRHERTVQAVNKIDVHVMNTVNLYPISKIDRRASRAEHRIGIAK
jgi:hypothetical protein